VAGALWAQTDNDGSRTRDAAANLSREGDLRVFRFSIQGFRVFLTLGDGEKTIPESRKAAKAAA
jgi:hypothetical protein